MEPDLVVPLLAAEVDGLERLAAARLAAKGSLKPAACQRRLILDPLSAVLPIES